MMVLAVGCTDDGPLIAPEVDDARVAPLVSAAAADGPRTMDVEFYDIASEVPGFGGFFRDEAGGATIFLKDLTRAAQAQAGIRGFAERHRSPITGPIRTVPGLFDWRDLYRWRGSLDELLGAPGVVQTDIDESRNRIVVGIADESARGMVLAELAQRGIPAAAVEFTPAGYPVPDATLRNTVRPVAGGLEIRRPIGSDEIQCTLGFIGTSGSAWFVTNSHCTSDTGVADGVVNNVLWYQATITSPNFIGTEQIDPPFFSGGSCPAGSTCRWSDSSLASFGTSNIAQGRIKRTSGANNGSITIVGDFRIAEERAFPDRGMTLNKVGRTTGWTSGVVKETCVNTGIGDGSNRKFLCQDKVDYGSLGGDSGSPVFRFAPWLAENDVQLVGIHWARDTENNWAIMSAMVNIEFETIQLNTCDPFFPPSNCT